MPEMFLARVPESWWDTAWDLSGNETNGQSVCFQSHPFPGVVRCFLKFFAL